MLKIIETAISVMIVRIDVKNGFEIAYHDNGQLKYEYNKINGLAEGDYISYFENGQIDREGEVVSGQQVGRWKYYFENCLRH